MKIFICLISAALALTGCVSGPISSQLSESHPAHPRAQASAEPIAAPMLVAGSQGLVLPVSTNQTEMQHEHHKQAPAGKAAQKPAEHKHEHK
jgi:hypothetical protein